MLEIDRLEEMLKEASIPFVCNGEDFRQEKYDYAFDEDTCFGVIGCYKKEIEPFIKAKFIGTKFDLPIVKFEVE